MKEVGIDIIDQTPKELSRKNPKRPRGYHPRRDNNRRRPLARCPGPVGKPYAAWAQPIRKRAPGDALGPSFRSSR
jgi:hypothetical protein